MSPGLINLDAERAVLGRILVDDRAWWDVSDRLASGDFSDPRNRAIYTAMRELDQRGRIITSPTLLAQVREPEQAVDLAGALARLKAEAPQASELRSSVDAVLHAAGRRKILASLDTIRDRVEVAGIDVPVESLVQDACKQIESADTDAPDQSSRLIDIVSKCLSDLKVVLDSGVKPGVRSGLRAYDELVGPMLPGELIVIGGETSSGKTALTMQLGAMLANEGVPVHVSSLEMTNEQLGWRFLGRWSDIPASKLSSGDINRNDFDKAFNMGQRADIPIHFDDTPQLSTSALQARIARAKVRHGIKVAIIDHLQYVRKDERIKGEPQQIARNVDDIKAMAKRLEIPVILVSHVSRSSSEDFVVQTAADIRRPRLRDLYGSSAIEKAADSVLFVHRPIWFLERATPGPGKKADALSADKFRWEGKAELVLCKRRAGEGTGIRVCGFNEKLTWFSDQVVGSDDQEGELGI